MRPTTNRQILLVSRPTGEPLAENFRLLEVPIRELREGEVLVRHQFLSLDPYMRGRMSEAKSYAPPQALNEVMLGGTVGVIEESLASGFAVGDAVVGQGGWQEYSIVDVTKPGRLRRVDTTHVPLSAYLGAVGMPGVTAWYGLEKIIRAKAGNTIVVSAASGAVGSAVGQLAKVRGMRAVGIAGGPEKCRLVTEEYGFDACIDYRLHQDVGSLSRALKEACPNGIDGHFENVGGMILDAVLIRANAFARVAICGMIAGYNGAPIPLQFPQLILTNRMTLEGFIVSEHMEVWPDALKELGTLVATEKLKYRETIAEGLESAPEAFRGLLNGKNVGKQLVRIA